MKLFTICFSYVWICSVISIYNMTVLTTLTFIDLMILFTSIFNIVAIPPLIYKVRKICE